MAHLLPTKARAAVLRTDLAVVVLLLRFVNPVVKLLRRAFTVLAASLLRESDALCGSRNLDLSLWQFESYTAGVG